MDIRDQGPYPIRGVGASLWDIQRVLAGDEINAPNRSYEDDPAMPAKVVRAKAKALIRRGLVDGCACACACRGDFNRTDTATPTEGGGQ